ncbi:MAG: hypothetical protein KF773_16230 [Deltaproteobacteria bacterium]|nr:hypothetical protein [Deltaproteobacteria bacterium]
MRFALLLAVAAACTKSSPSSPPSSAAIQPADLSTFTLDPAAGFRTYVERGAGPSFVEVTKHTDAMTSKYDVWPWDPSWPTDAAGFAAKLPQLDFIDDAYRYDVAPTSQTDDAWEFRGTDVHRSGDRRPTFLLVRTIDGKRFLCKGRRVEDPGAMDAAIASCRGAKLSAR